MMPNRKQIPLTALRLVLGLVVLIQSFQFLFSADSANFFARHGLPNAVRLLLGWTEIGAALLFLLPPTMAIGACALLVVFAAAILLHVLHGQFEIGGLFIYAAAVWVVLADSKAGQGRVHAGV